MTRAKQEGILAVYAYTDDLIRAVGTMRDRGFPIMTVFSPFRLPELQSALGRGPSMIRLVVLLGGITGAVGMVSLAVYAHLSFKLITFGKPILPWVPWVVVCFEGMVLFGVLFGFVGWIFKGRLPQARLPAAYSAAFSNDRFGLLVACSDMDRRTIADALRRAGAEDVRELSAPESGGEWVLRASEEVRP